MKYLVMTSPDSQGLSEVFFSAILPVELAPANLIERWDRLVENSPITVESSEGKYSLLIDNETISIITNNEPEDEARLTAGFSEPVVIKSVEDSSKIDLGYFWDGNEFLAPEGV
jgi:hypothetical protein